MQNSAVSCKIFLEQFSDKFEVKRLRVNTKQRAWELEIRVKSLMLLSELGKIEESLCREFKLTSAKFSVEECVCTDAHSVVKDYWGELKDLVVKANPSFIGFLKDAKVTAKDNKIHVKVLNKDVAGFLNLRKCDSIFEKHISEYLKTNCKVVIDSDVERIEHDEYVNSVIEEESKMVEEALKAQRAKVSAPSSNKTGSSKPSNDLQGNVILGKSFFDPPVKISEIVEDSGRLTVEGSIFSVESRALNNGKTILTFNVTDMTNSITVKLFIKDEANRDKLLENITEGKNVRIKGDVQLDPFIKELVIYPLNIVETEKPKKRVDAAERKRIELHAHTSMSAMDGFCSASQLIKRAKEWGHKAIAITDHGVVQSFPEAYETSLKTGVKVIYGVEGYFVNDGIPIAYNPKEVGFDEEFVVFDIETTGLSATSDKITEIGAVKLKNGVIIDTFSRLINPEVDIPELITKLTGITNEMVRNEQTVKEVLPEFLSFAGNAPLVAHNALFDWGFIRVKGEELGLKFDNPVIDTLQLSRNLLTELKKHKLNIICDHLNIKLENHHRATDDATATAYIFLKFVEMLKARDIHNVADINQVASGNINLKSAENFHIIIMVKNMTGLKNLYKLISISHLNYFYKKPRILKSLLMQYREGLIIGSACEAGEIYRSILNNSDDNTIMEKAKFYDYLEIQPNGNNEFLIRTGRVKGQEELNEINKKIVSLGEKLGKPVVATGDIHFLDPEDEIYRRIIMGGQGFSDADEQAPLYFKTTEDMLEEFSYLGKAKAHEVVIANPEKILEMMEDIKPIPDETYPPIIPGSEEQIREMTMKKAYSIYGDELPEVIIKRLDKELNSIINNGYAVMYLIAQKLVTKSLQDGYLVGSRGSVGSSFVATMCDITEVNPLPPHYICPNCKNSEFILDGSVGSGADMPEKDCPGCGTRYIKEGHDIPFEMFLGFDGDKEPDIDLNFAGEYQPEAHKYTEELFGKGYVFRAGTIGTIAEKTAYGFIKKYYDEKNIKLNSAEANRLVKGCTGIKRTTGQHPGGVMIVPDYKEIYDFTPIQRPADDTTSSIITTHFDYHSISGRILKLDILGHDVPTIIRMLEDMTGFGVNKIPLDDPKTMSLFTATEALNIKLDEIDCKVGSLGIPEFGTKFVRQMLIDTQPKTFAELVRISGLSHGTDVWLNNAQDLIINGTTNLNGVISTRDDIMLYLIYKGVKPKTAFKTAESVRKGKGLTEEMEQAMKEAGVPDWYITSCKTVKYLFPKAHATAYVMMSFRIAYYKVYYPEAFYATYFYVKIEDFDADLIVKGKEAVLAKWIEIDKKGNTATTKEKNQMTLLESVYEMYMRGIKLLPVDLYKSSANKFLLTPEGILPPLNALQGVGINAAISIVNAREQSSFISVDELRERSKASRTVIEILKNHGCLQGIPENNQLSLF